jgi:hypothetical protein
VLCFVPPCENFTLRTSIDRPAEPSKEGGQRGGRVSESLHFYSAHYVFMMYVVVESFLVICRNWKLALGSRTFTRTRARLPLNAQCPNIMIIYI